jgi:hypothetical protein
MSISPNMTDKHLDAVMAALPDNMEEEELCALTLTIYAAYHDDPAEVFSGLISAIYAYGKAQGLSSGVVSMGLRLMADVYDTKPKTQH